jgi:hypothetical protein
MERIKQGTINLDMLAKKQKSGMISKENNIEKFFTLP